MLELGVLNRLFFFPQRLGVAAGKITDANYHAGIAVDQVVSQVGGGSGYYRYSSTSPPLQGAAHLPGTLFCGVFLMLFSGMREKQFSRLEFPRWASFIVV